MIPKTRIAMIRFSQKLDRNSEYAQRIGVSIENRKAEAQQEKVQIQRENDCFIKEGNIYEYKNCR